MSESDQIFGVVGLRLDDLVSLPESPCIDTLSTWPELSETAKSDYDAAVVEGEQEINESEWLEAEVENCATS